MALTTAALAGMGLAAAAPAGVALTAVAPAAVAPAGGARPGVAPSGVPGATAGVGAAVAGTPLLSVRRVPTWIDDTVGTQRLTAALAEVVTPAALGPTGRACLVVTQGARTLASTSPAVAMTPASNMKLLTAAAALDRLGPTFRYTTTVRADGAAVAGVVTGNLYLVGGGDPVLRTPAYQPGLRNATGSTTSLPVLAAQVRAAGITRVTGTVVGDESRYDTQRVVPTWDPVYAAEGDVGPLSALSVDDGFVPIAGGYAAAPQPAQAAAAAFAAALAAAGVAVATPAGAVGATPAAAVPVTAVRSPPLSQVLTTVLAPSDDTAAELVTKELGVAAHTAPTTTAGAAAVVADLTAAGLPMAGVTAVDGSGLDRADRVTCGLLSAVLNRAGPTGDLSSELAVAGRSGTLQGRLRSGPATGRVRAKTGTLSDVSALSGFVAPTSPPPPTALLAQPLVFSFIANGAPSAVAVGVGDRLATALATYPVVPALASIGPLP